MKLLGYRDKMKVMKNVSKFKGSNWYVTEDYSQSVRSVRKKLWVASASFRNSGSEVRLRFDKLFIDNIRYTLDATSNTLVKVPSRQSSRHPAPPPGSSSPPWLPHRPCNDLTILNVNARSLLNKFPSFVFLVSTFSPHVIGVTESWLHEGVFDSEITPPGYVLVRNDRQNGKGGGVALLFRSDLKFTLLPVALDVESVWCKLYLNKHHLMVGVCYRPPGTSVDPIRNLNS